MLFDRNIVDSSRRGTFIVQKAKQNMDRLVRNTMRKIETKRSGASTRSLQRIQREQTGDSPMNSHRSKLTENAEAKTLLVYDEESKISIETMNGGRFAQRKISVVKEESSYLEASADLDKNRMRTKSTKQPFVLSQINEEAVELGNIQVSFSPDNIPEESNNEASKLDRQEEVQKPEDSNVLKNRPISRPEIMSKTFNAQNLSKQLKASMPSQAKQEEEKDSLIKLPIADFKKKMSEMDKALSSNVVIAAKVKYILDDIGSSKDVLEEIFSKKEKEAEDEEAKEKERKNSLQLNKSGVNQVKSQMGKGGNFVRIEGEKFDIILNILIGIRRALSTVIRLPG